MAVIQARVVGRRLQQQGDDQSGLDQDSGLEGWGGLELLHVPGQKPRFRVWGLGKAS